MTRRLGDDETAVLRELERDAREHNERERDDDHDDDDYPEDLERYRDHEPRYTDSEIDDFFRVCEESEIPF